MKKKLCFILILGFVSVFLPNKVKTESTKEVLAGRTMRSDGDTRIQWGISVGSTTPISPFANVSFTDGIASQLRELRRVGFVNQTSYYIHIGTWASFIDTQAFWTVDRSSIGVNALSSGPRPLSSWETLNHATFYMLMEINAATFTVRGFMERD